MSKPTDCRIVTVERQLTAVVKNEAPMSEMQKVHQSSRAKLQAALPQLDAGPLGPFFARWRPPEGGRIEIEPGIIVSRGFEPVGEVVPSELPEGRAAFRVLKGGFEGLGEAWGILFDWCAAEKLALAGINWEIYPPADADPETQETRLHALLK